MAQTSNRLRRKTIDERPHRGEDFVWVGPEHIVVRVRQEHDRRARKPAGEPTGEFGRLLQPPSRDRRVDADTRRTIRCPEDREHRTVNAAVSLTAVIDRAAMPVVAAASGGSWWSAEEIAACPASSPALTRAPEDPSDVAQLRDCPSPQLCPSRQPRAKRRDGYSTSATSTMKSPRVPSSYAPVLGSR